MNSAAKFAADVEENTSGLHSPARDGNEVLLHRVRLRARRCVLWMSAAWQDARSSSEIAISQSEVERILEGPRKTEEREAQFYQEDSEARKLGEEIAAVDREFLRLPAWSSMRQQFGLSDFETDLLVLAVAVCLEPSLRRVYAYLNDDAGADEATPWLTGILFHYRQPVLLSAQSPLFQWHLARPMEGYSNPWAVNVAWAVDPHIMLWLAGHRSMDPALAQCLQFVPVAETAARHCLYPEEMEAMTRFVRTVRPPADERRALAHGALEIELVGTQGSGRRTLAAQFAASFGADLIVVDVERLLGAEQPSSVIAERIVRAKRMAGLLRAILYWHGVERVSAHVVDDLRGSSGINLFGSETGSVKQTCTAAARLSLRLPALRRDSRLALWHHLTPQPAPHVIDDWTLTPAEIVAAATVAPAGPELVTEVCQQNLRGTPAELFTPLPCPYTWDDIILPPHLREHLAELEQQVRLRQFVYEDWGFERLCPMGRGITGMFCGPSGTGKTMAAQVLARALDMKLFRVDLAGVMNKYIGETEKRLKQVFDACERSNVLLFFDEADALFGQRTQVKDAHDRFANIEIDYLLQRMEQFDGVAILATNRKGDLDKAFVRRIRFMLDFQQPGPAERLAMWHRALQPSSPAGEQLLGHVDMELLAEKLNMTGADITSAALGAAFLARAESTLITMSHVLHAARREMTKHGQVLRSGDWES